MSPAFYVLLFPNIWGWTVFESPPLVPSLTIPSLMFSTHIFLQNLPLIGLPGDLPTTSKFVAHLIIWSSSLVTTWPNHLSLVLRITATKLSSLHLLSTSSHGTGSSHLTFGMYLHILVPQFLSRFVTDLYILQTALYVLSNIVNRQQTHTQS